MAPQDGVADRRAEPAREQLIATIGVKRYRADWANNRHRARRLLSEFIGMFGLLFVLSSGAAVMTAYAGAPVGKLTLIALPSLTSALWLVAAIYFLGNVSAHFNPAVTFAFALRGDMRWAMAVAYAVVQVIAAGAGSLLARAFFGTGGHLAATMPPPGHSWQAVAFEAILTGGLVLMVLALADGPKLNGPFVPLAVGAYIVSLGTTGGLFDGAAMNPARAFGPDLALGDFGTLWVYVVGPLLGAGAAVLLDLVLSGGGDGARGRRCAEYRRGCLKVIILGREDQMPDMWAMTD